MAVIFLSLLHSNGTKYDDQEKRVTDNNTSVLNKHRSLYYNHKKYRSSYENGS